MKKQLLIWAGAVIVLDQASKWLAAQAGWPITLNSGISFQLLADSHGWWPQARLVGLIALVIFLAWWARAWWLQHPRIAGLFLGGAISNLLDRLWWGGVRDWLPVPGLNLSNNLADWALSLAVVWLIGSELRTALTQRSTAFQAGNQGTKSDQKGIQKGKK